MRRRRVTEDDAALSVARALGFAAGKLCHLLLKARDLGVLTRDDLRQVVHRADEMGQAFLDLAHGADLPGPRLPVKLAPPRPLV